MELTPVRVPFKELIKQTMAKSETGLGMAIKAEEEWQGADCAICKLYCDDGHFGLGESFTWYPETGISPVEIIEVIKSALFHYIIEESPFNVERILYRMNRNVARNEVAKGLCDMACYDLMGQILGRPACDLIGGRTVEAIDLAALIPQADIETMMVVAKMFQKQGIKTFRYKLGTGINEDVKVSEAIRDNLGESVNLRVDYNQAYNPAEAVRAIKAIEKFNIDLAEQPVQADNFLGMAYVQKRVDTPLMAHESFFSLQDLSTLVELQAIGILGVNSERPGGVTNALKAIAYAEQRGMQTIIHNQPLGIASAMHIHLAAAKYYSLGGNAIELFGHVMWEDDLIRSPLNYDKGLAKVPSGPGWGVELDEKALEKYATGPTVQIGTSL
jgi:muconate cycloisomerase